MGGTKPDILAELAAKASRTQTNTKRANAGSGYNAGQSIAPGARVCNAPRWANIESGVRWLRQS